jgi:hypothetical protein
VRGFIADKERIFDMREQTSEAQLLSPTIVPSLAAYTTIVAEILRDYRYFDSATESIGKTKTKFIEIEKVLIDTYRVNIRDYMTIEQLKLALVEKYRAREAKSSEKIDYSSGIQPLHANAFNLKISQLLNECYFFLDTSTDTIRIWLANVVTGKIVRAHRAEMDDVLPREKYETFYRERVYYAHPQYIPTSTSLNRLIIEQDTLQKREIHTHYYFNNYNFAPHRVRHIKACGDLSGIKANKHHSAYVKVFEDYLRFLASTDEDFEALLFLIAGQVRCWEFTRREMLVFLIAEEGVGKTTLFKMLSLLHGDDNCIAREGREGIKDYRITDLMNKTLLYCNEVVIKDEADYDRFKILTDRFMAGDVHYQGNKRVKNHLNVWVATNHFHKLRGLRRESRRDVIIGVGGKGKLDKFVNAKIAESKDGIIYQCIHCDREETKMPKDINIDDYIASIFAHLCDLGPDRERKLVDFMQSSEAYRNEEHAEKIYKASSPQWVFEFFAKVVAQVKKKESEYLMSGITLEQKRKSCGPNVKYWVLGIEVEKILAGLKAKNASKKYPGGKKFYSQMKQYDKNIKVLWNKTLSAYPDLLFSELSDIDPSNFEAEMDGE